MSKAWALRPLPWAAISAGSTAAGYDAAYMGNDHAGVVWRSAGGAGSVTITVDAGSAQAIDSALFFGCTGADGAWTLTVESADNSGFSVNQATLANAIPFLAGATMPTHGRGVGYWAADTTITARRWWRFTIGNLSSAQVTVARLAIGTRIQLERNFAFGGAWGVKDLGSVDRSAHGVLIRRRAAKLRVLGLTFPAVTKDEAETAIQPLLEHVAGQEAVVIITDPDADALRQARCWIGFLTGELGTIWRTASGWEWRANLTDLIPIPKSG